MEQAEHEPLKEEKGETEREHVKVTFKDKLRNIRDNITLEPLLACFVIPGTLARLATQNLNLDKACRVNKGFGDKVCNALLARKGNYLKQEIAVQELVASMEMWKSVLLTSIPSFLILFLGAWSDRTRKRKICILLPIIGDLLMCLSNILNAYYFYELPVQVTMFMEAIFPAITGGWVCSYMGIFSYISDITTEETRTFRVGVLNLCLTAGGPIGSALSGILLKAIGYYGVFGICSAMYTFSLVYGICYIKDIEPPSDVVNKTNKPKGVCEFLRSFFDLNHVKDTFAVAFRKGPNHRRLKSIFIFVAIGLIYGPAYGEYTNRYMFTRYRFNWDALKYSFYNTFYICVHALGALVSISLFSRKLKCDDSVLGLLSSISKIAGGLTTGLSRTSFHMYLGVVVETFNATSYTALRSISSKLVSSNELGKMTSLFNLMEIVTSMVFGPLYSWLYMITLSIDAGFIFYVSAVLTFPAVLIHVWFNIQHKKEAKQKKKQVLSEKDNKEISDNKQKENSNILINSREMCELDV